MMNTARIVVFVLFAVLAIWRGDLVKVDLLARTSDWPLQFKPHRRRLIIALVLATTIWFVCGLAFIRLDSPGFGNTGPVQRDWWGLPETVPPSPVHVQLGVIAAFVLASSVLLWLLRKIGRRDEENRSSFSASEGAVRRADPG